MKRLQSFLTLLVLLLISVTASFAATLEVGSGKPYTTIQAAVTAASGGDIIEVYSGTYTENVNIPAGKNGLIIREKALENAILDGTTVGNPKVAFRVSSDNVTIQGFTIQNYKYSGAINVGYGQAQRGVAIEALNASSQHTFTNNTINNCNWGIYVREGNNLTIQDNEIDNFISTTYAGTWSETGGVGIAFLSNGIAMDGNFINQNLLNNVGTSGAYGIVYGRRTGGNVGSDFVKITNNSVVNGSNNGFFAYGIFNIKSNETINFSNNTSNGNYSALDIASSSATDNEDVTFTNNSFIYTNGTDEVRASDNYSGEKLWELMMTNGNVFSSGADISNTIVSVDYTNNVITSNGTYRYILNNLNRAVTEAEFYLAAPNPKVRVYITNGTYAGGTATINGIGTKDLFIQGQSSNAIIMNIAGVSPIIDIQAGTVEIDPLTITSDLASGNVVAINANSANTNIHDVVFTSTNNGGNSYKALIVNNAASGILFEDNNVSGAIYSAIDYDSQNGKFTCNTFNNDVAVASNSGIYVYDINSTGEVVNLIVESNNFKGNFATSIRADVSANAGSTINIGSLNKGNTFESSLSTATAISITQIADNQVVVKGNKFDVTYQYFFNNTAAFVVNAGFNYWNVATPYTTTIPATITGAGASNIAWLPIFTSGTDVDNTSCGFQPDSTSIWTPVYTALNFTDDIYQAANKFYLTVEAALNDPSTTSGTNDNVFLYLTQLYAETNAAVLTFNSADITVAAAPAQTANSNTRPSPSISSTYAGPIFDVNYDNTGFDKLKFISGTNSAYYPIQVTENAFHYLNVFNCIFDVSNASGPDAAIFFSGTTSRQFIHLHKNSFTIGNGNYAVDFGTTAAIINSGMDIDSNTVTATDNLSKAIRFGQVDNLDIFGNNFEAGLEFNAGTANSDDIDIYGNTFNASTSSSDKAIEFLHDGVAAGIYDNVLIEQNKISQFKTGIDINITGGASANVGNFSNWGVYSNYFTDIGADGIDLNGLVPINKLQAINNHWQSNYGPQAYSIAPVWHDDAGNPIISNSYGFLYNDNSGVNVVPLQDATYIQFVPWWNDITGTPGSYTGTSFAPIENNEVIPEYFASLIFAIDETPTTDDIYMQDVPDWTNPNQTLYYVESNTIENANKDLNIWGQPFWPPTTKIATVGNDATDNMFLIENGTVGLNFLGFTYDQTAVEDIENAIQYDVNGVGTVDWCHFFGIRSTTGESDAIYLSDGTNDVTITNSKIEDIAGASSYAYFGIYAELGSTLAVDNTEIIGNNNNGAGDTDYGIMIYDNTNLTLTNSTIYNFNSDSFLSSSALKINATGTPGNITLYQNVFDNNQYGIYLLDGDFQSTTSIHNNIIRNNKYAGLYYSPMMAILNPLNADNNNWGSDNGPKSRAQLGNTQNNTYNEIAQGNAVVDGDANSEIIYLPFRRWQSDDLTTKIAGPRFAPIVRTNSANLAKGLYANFTDAHAALTTNQKIYAYAGTYTEQFSIDKSNVQFIGKLAASPYSVGWILAPNAPQFVNAWVTGTQGATSGAPVISNEGLAQPLITAGPANFDHVSFNGFVFNTNPTASPADAYTGNPTTAIQSLVNTDNIDISYNSFTADANDKGIKFGSGLHNKWNLTYNKYTGSAAGYFTYLDASNVVTDVTINYNDLNGGSVYINKAGAGTINTISVSKNNFANTTGAILLDGNVGAPGQDLYNLTIQNNRFLATNTYAFLIDASADDGMVHGSDWTTNVVFTNNEVLVPAGSQIAVGFDNADPLSQYSNEITATCNWWGSAFGPTFALNPGGNGARVSEAALFAPWLSGYTSSTTFEFTPTDACNVGERVWVNTTGNPATKTIVFPSLQMAVQHPSVVNGTNEFIFVSDAYNSPNNDAGLNYIEENISIDWNGAFANTLFAETPSNELHVNGNFALSGTNGYDVNLGSALRVVDTLFLDNPGTIGQFVLGAKDLTVEGEITDASYGAVVTNGTGYLVKEHVITGGINRFPITYTNSGTATPAQFVANTSGFTSGQNNILKVRTNNTNPVVAKGMGEDGYDLNNLWTIDWTNNNGTTNPDFALTLRFLDDVLNDAGFTLNKNIAYAAYWDMAPVATQWTTTKSSSSWNGSDGVIVNHLNLETGQTDWALFYGATSFALSDAPTQAKNIQWIGGDDRNLTFQWQRNGTNNQFYAILGIQGTMTSNPVAFGPVPNCGAGASSPWTCAADGYNFSDGYVDNVTTPSWTSALFHNGATLPADVKVLKVGKYTGSLSENVTVSDLNQGTYYTFFVANFNYGDGNTAIADMETGADGMTNYNLNSNTLNPRTRKTQPAVYMTLDASSAFAGNASNKPNLVYGTTLPHQTQPADMFTAANYWRINGTLTGNTVVKNQYNNDALTGGNYAEFCNPSNFSANNILLYFKGYGNNGGTNWAIKYSENNNTYTFTSPFVNSNTSRTRNVATKYYLVSAYDGDGKVAALYDNNKDLQFIFDQSTTLASAISGTLPTCAHNAVTFTSNATSIPAANFIDWEVSTDNGATYSPVSVLGAPISSAYAVSGTDINFSDLNYADNGKLFRAKYVSNSVCDYPTLGAAYYTTPIKLEIYDDQLTGSTPANAAVCSDVASATFVSNEGTLVSPNDLTLVNWEVSTDNGGTWNVVAGGDYSVNTVGNPSVSTLTVSNIVGKDDYQFRAVWSNGDCATSVPTGAATLNVVTKPVVDPIAAPAAVCINQNITIASNQTATLTGTTTIQWMISSDNITYNAITSTSDATVSGANTATITITPLTLAWDGYYVKVVYTHTENGIDCVTESNAVQIDELPTPVFNTIANQTVCENTNMTVTATDAANPISWTGNVQWYYNNAPNMTGANLMTSGNTYNGSVVTINGASNATFTINSTDLAWNNVYVLAYNDNGSCSGYTAFQVSVDEAPSVGTATVTAGEVCEGLSVDYDVTYTPASTATVQWYYNGVLVVDGTSVTSNAYNNATILTTGGNSKLTLSNVSVQIDGIGVYAVVSNGVCASVTSNTVAADIETIPVAPSTVGAQNILSHKFDVTWTGVANADNYEIQVSDVSDYSNIVVTQTVAAPAVNWAGMTNCTLDPATTYYFRVRAINQCGAGPWRQSNMVTLDPTVVSLNYTVGNGNFGNVEVGSNSVANTYRITYYQLDAGLQVVVPTDYAIMPAGSVTWLNGTVDLTPYLTMYLGTPGTPLTLDVQVRFSPTSCGLNKGDLVHSSLETCTGVTEMLETEINAGANDDVTGTGVVAAPTTASSNGVVMENTPGTFSATWTNGNGNSRLVILSENATLSATPVNNTTYVVGDAIGDGTVVDVISGIGNSSSITVPVDGKNYYVHVWEYNACGANTEQYGVDYSFEPYYLAFGTTIPDQVSGVESGNVTVNLTERNGTIINNPKPTFNVSIAQNPATGSFSTNPNPVQLVNGNSSTTFKFTWTENCGVDDGYLTASAANINSANSNTFDLNVTTPTMQARIIVWVGIPCANSTTFKWTNGNGAGRLVVARDGALPIAPSDFQVFGENSDWSAKGASNLIGDASYALGAITGSNNEITITNLEINHTYYFRLFEYNGCVPQLRKYLTSNATFNPRSRTINCKEGNNLFDIVLDKFNAKSNNGKGILNFNTLYEANISGFELRRMNVTDEEMDGILVGSYMNNSELVAAGNTMTGKSYSFTDNSSLLEVGKTYLYSLTAIAFDGTRIEVAETELTINDEVYSGISEFSMSPVTVTNNEARFDLTVNKAHNVNVTLYDVKGQKIASIANDYRVNRGTSQFTTNIQNITNGTYMIVVEADGISSVQKFQIVR